MFKKKELICDCCNENKLEEEFEKDVCNDCFDRHFVKKKLIAEVRSKMSQEDLAAVEKTKKNNVDDLGLDDEVEAPKESPEAVSSEEYVEIKEVKE